MRDVLSKKNKRIIYAKKGQYSKQNVLNNSIILRITYIKKEQEYIYKRNHIITIIDMQRKTNLYSMKNNKN